MGQFSISFTHTFTKLYFRGFFFLLFFSLCRSVFQWKIVQIFKRFCSSLCPIFISNYQHVIHHPFALFNEFAVISMIDAIHFINQCRVMKHRFFVSLPLLPFFFVFPCLRSLGPSSSTNYQTVRNTNQ